MPLDGDVKQFESPSVEKPDVFSLEGLIAWLRRMPANRAYDFWNPHECLFSQYLQHHGWHFGGGRKDGLDIADAYIKLSTYWNGIARGEPWTFGAALKRTEDEIAKSARALALKQQGE